MSETDATATRISFPSRGDARPPAADAADEHPHLALAEVAAAVRFVARERPSAVEVLLWAVCSSAELIDVCSETQLSAHVYAEVAGIDGVVQAVLLASPDSRSLLRAGLRSSTPAVRQRVQTTAPPPSAASLTREDVAAACCLVARELPSAIESLLWAVCRSPTLVALCRQIAPDARDYAEVACLDGIVDAVLSASPEGRALLADLGSSPKPAEVEE